MDYNYEMCFKNKIRNLSNFNNLMEIWEIKVVFIEIMIDYVRRSVN